ncbi:MAG TPA: DUF6328 family protein [Nitrospira sp.]|nr:DUF6328 family protein [Nitrospira sp.]
MHKLLPCSPSISYEKEPLPEVASHILEECRMVLPGIQALFGFQLIVVFNGRFWEGLNGNQRVLHLAATMLVALAVALVMTPAAYHRQVLRDAVSHSFIEFSSRLLLYSMFPLLLGIALDMYLIAAMILDSTLPAAFVSLFLICLYVGLWFVLPRVLRPESP